MVSQTEQDHRPHLQETNTLSAMVSRIPEAISFAKLEMEASRQAQTPEGKFILTYLFATRNLLRPTLIDPAMPNSDMMRPIGGYAYNPERTIDKVGTTVAMYLAEQTADIPHLFIRTEEGIQWERVGNNEKPVNEGERFAIIDPLDESSGITSGHRVQSTGIAIYDRNGKLITLGIISLVDDSMMFAEYADDELRIYPHTSEKPPEDPNQPIRVATLTRRMHALKNLPLFTTEHATWSMPSIGGYAVLSMLKNEVDVILDPLKGNPWIEYCLWGPAAEEFGFTVSDPKGNPIDRAAIVRSAIEKNSSNAERIPFIISRTPEIHRRVLSLLAKPS